VLLDVTPDQSMLDEGVAREVINRIQKLRKKAHLVPADDITVFYEASGKLSKICKDFTEFIYGTIKQPLKLRPHPADAEVIIAEDMQVKGDNLGLTFVRGHTDGDSGDTKSSVSNNGPGPWCRFVNVELVGKSPQMGAKGVQATVLLENPRGDFPISFDDLKRQVGIIFGFQGRKIKLFKSKNLKSEVDSVKNTFSLHATTLYANVC